MLRRLKPVRSIEDLTKDTKPTTSEAWMKDDEKDYSNSSNTEIHKLHRYRSRSRELGSGDHENSYDKYMRLCPEDGDTTLQYKNTNFSDSNTSIDSVGFECTSDLKSTKERRLLSDGIDDLKVNLQRPIVCPSVECGKIITVSTALLHFLFDHSKIQRSYYSCTTTNEVLIKASALSSSSRCFALFLPSDSSRSNVNQRKIESCAFLHKKFKNNSLLLLMGATFRQVELGEKAESCSFHTTIGNNDDTQTLQNSSKTTVVNVSHGFEDDDTLLLWLTKIDEKPVYYSVTLLREDNRIGHTYIGEALHVSNKQDAATIYRKSECLIINGVAVNKVLKGGLTIRVLVNIFEE